MSGDRVGPDRGERELFGKFPTPDVRRDLACTLDVDRSEADRRRPGQGYGDQRFRVARAEAADLDEAALDVASGQLASQHVERVECSG